MAEDFIKRLITFVKSLPEFSLLSRNDQVCLLKVSCLHTLDSNTTDKADYVRLINHIHMCTRRSGL